MARTTTMKLSAAATPARKPAPCPHPECQKVLSGKGELKRHYDAVHLKIKPFICPQLGCEKAFLQKQALDNHMTSHGDDRPFTCEVHGCQASFKDRTSKSRHKREAHGNVTHQCPYVTCSGTRIMRSDAFKRHLKEKHKVQAQDLTPYKINIPHPAATQVNASAMQADRLGGNQIIDHEHGQHLPELLSIGADEFSLYLEARDTAIPQVSFTYAPPEDNGLLPANIYGALPAEYNCYSAPERLAPTPVQHLQISHVDHSQQHPMSNVLPVSSWLSPYDVGSHDFHSGSPSVSSGNQFPSGTTTPSLTDAYGSPYSALSWSSGSTPCTSSGTSPLPYDINLDIDFGLGDFKDEAWKLEDTLPILDGYMVPQATDVVQAAPDHASKFEHNIYGQHTTFAQPTPVYGDMPLYNFISQLEHDAYFM